MKHWTAPICAVLITILTIGLVVVTSQASARRALFDLSGESQIYREHKASMDKLDVVAPDGVGYAGNLLEFGKLADQLNGKYAVSEMVKLAKHQQPVVAMLGMELLARNRCFDFLVRFHEDSRVVRYRSGCTVNSVKPIGFILGEYWGLDDYRQQHHLQLSWFGVVLRWEMFGSAW
jgi:hypothetical protein